MANFCGFCGKPTVDGKCNCPEFIAANGGQKQENIPPYSQQQAGVPPYNRQQAGVPPYNQQQVNAPTNGYQQTNNPPYGQQPSQNNSQVYKNQNNPPKTGDKKKIMIFAIVAAVILVGLIIAAVALMSGGGSDDDGGYTPAISHKHDDESSRDDSSSADDESSASGNNSSQSSAVQESKPEAPTESPTEKPVTVKLDAPVHNGFADTTSAGSVGQVVTVSWKPVAGADGYEISESILAEGDEKAYGRTYNIFETEYSIGASVRTSVVLKVRAFKNTGSDVVYSDWSTEASYVLNDKSSEVPTKPVEQPTKPAANYQLSGTYITEDYQNERLHADIVQAGTKFYVRFTISTGGNVSYHWIGSGSFNKGTWNGKVFPYVREVDLETGSNNYTSSGLIDASMTFDSSTGTITADFPFGTYELYNENPNNGYTAQPLYGTVITKDDNLNVRDSAGGEVIGKLAKGSQVMLIDTTTNWYIVYFNGVFGHVAAEYIKIN